jgi:hypothetical protein
MIQNLNNYIRVFGELQDGKLGINEEHLFIMSI